MDPTEQRLIRFAPRFFGQALAATYLGISERAFEAFWRRGEMPAPVKFGRRLLWDRKILDDWADAVSGLDGSTRNDFDVRD